MTNPVRFLVGCPADWRLRRPRWPHLPALSTALLGPLAIVATTGAGWWAFDGAIGRPGTPTALFVGSVAIMLMAWSFVLSVRPRLLEPFFGGLDSMYRAHRWAGSLSIVFMWLHTTLEPDVKNGVAGASKSVAEAAEELAETGQTLLYILIGLTLVRLVPYRWWRLTHKLIGLPFAMACWHFYTVTKPYANGSSWGWWFGTWMVIGLGAWLLRVVGIDMVARGRRYRVETVEHHDSVSRLLLAPKRGHRPHRVGQFVFVKLDVAGLREPHPFTIASSQSDDGRVEFMVRRLGDWSNRLPSRDLVGSTARVEGPFGRFHPFPRQSRPTVWIAGGVGATPFLAAAATPRPDGLVPTVLYAVRSTEDNPMLDRLQAAADAGRIRLEVFASQTDRMGPADLDRCFPDGMAGYHVALCGPPGLVTAMGDAARARGAWRIETEDFDIRQGLGPERSTEFDRLRRRGRRSVDPASDRSAVEM